MERGGTQSRNVIPRWRSLARTTSQELKSAKSFSPALNAVDIEKRYQELYRLWRDAPSISAASDVIDSAVLLKDPHLAIGPAKSILNNENAMPAVKRLAEHVLNGATYSDPEAEERKLVKSEIIDKIRSLKRRGLDEPRNAMLLMERARLQTLVGDIRGASTSLDKALKIAPENRQVLRAQATLSAHVNEPDKGRAILMKAQSLRHDPWLQSAEIALADLAERDPYSAKYVQTAVREELDPRHLSEAAAALGTIEISAGSNRRANKLFRYSLLRPTENSLSQAFWVRDTLNFNIGIDNQMLSIKGAFEARVSAAAEQGNWELALNNCTKWLADEPFSRRAVSEGSHIAISMLWMPQEAIRLCDTGLIANPNDFAICNNKAVALARFGDVRSASKILSKLSPSTVEQDIYFAATTGLIDFRAGRLQEGRDSYQVAIMLARDARAIDVEIHATIHWLYEEVSAGALDNTTAIELMQKLRSVIEKSPACPRSTLDVADSVISRLKEGLAMSPQTDALDVASYIAELLKRREEGDFY